MPKMREEHSAVQLVGHIDRKIYSVISDDIRTDEVVITQERIDHIRQRHPGDYERFAKYIVHMVENPQYILEANRPHTAFVLNEYMEDGERFELILRLSVSSDPETYENSVITFLRVNERKWAKYLRNKKILYKSE